MINANTLIERWAHDVLRDCLLEAGDDTEAGFEAAEYILSTQSIPADLDTTQETPAQPSISAFFAHDIHNRRAQGILNRSLQAMSNLTEEARRDLTAVIGQGVADSGRAILEFIEKYRTQLTRLLSTTQLAAVLEGAREVAAKIPVLATFAGAVTPPPSLGPLEAVTLVEKLEKLTSSERAEAIYNLPTDQQVYTQQAIAAKEASPPIVPPDFTPPSPPPGSPGGIHFPTIDGAVRQLSEKNAITRDSFDALDAATKAKSFTVAGVEAEDTLTKIRDALAENLREGADYETFKQKVLDSVDEGTFLSPAHMETVFRANIQSALSDGQETVLGHPLVRSGFPYRAYDAIHDDRARKNHLALEKLGIGGTNIYRADDPVFQLFRPPWDYNDRCGSTPMTVRQAAEAGIAEAVEWLATGTPPANPTHVPMPPFSPPPGFQRALVSAPLSIQLSLRPMASFNRYEKYETEPQQYPGEPLSNTGPPLDPEYYPRNNSNQFLDKHRIVEAANDPDAAVALRESIPEDKQWKLDHAVTHLQSGGTVHHPSEPAGMAVNVYGIVVDHRWSDYVWQLKYREEWVERNTEIVEQRGCVEEAIKLIREDDVELGKVDKLLEDAGATGAELRSLSRMRHRIKVSGMDVVPYRDTYESVAEAIHQRLDEREERDPDPGEPEEPEDTAAIALSTDAADGTDKEHRIGLIAGILVLLFGDKAVEVAKRLKAESGSQDRVSAMFGYDVHGNYHGPNPPSPTGWIQIGVGPLGGLIWSNVSAQTLPGGVPVPGAAPQGQYVQSHQKRLVNATSAYHSALSAVGSGQSLSPKQAADLAKNLSVMNRQQLSSLYAALGGTAAIVGTQRQPWVHAIKAILSGQPAPAAPAPVPAPSPTPQPTPTQPQPTTPPATPPQTSTSQPPPSSLHRGANVVGGHAAAQQSVLQTTQSAPTAPMSTLPAVPMQDETSWETGTAKPGTLNGVDFAPAPPKFWEKVKDVDVGEPPPLRRIDRASVVVREPDGRVWIVKPTNEFGDRKYTLPGGGVEAGLTNQQNAMKEVWEETGLQIKITGFAGDFEDSNNGNNGRLYVGERVGGAPWDAKVESHITNHKTGKPAAESETVMLVTPDRAAKLLHRTDDVAQLWATSSMPLDTPVSGKGSGAIKKLVAAIEPARQAYEAEKNRKNQSTGNGYLHAVQEMRGFNGKPKVVKKKDMDTLIKQGGHIELLRGLKDVGYGRKRVVAKELADDLKTGEHYPGYGIYGSGTYADSNKGNQNVASGAYSNFGSGAVVRMALPKDARIVKVSELEAKVPNHPDLFSGYSAAGSGSRSECWRGVQAALAGYDAIHMDGGSLSHSNYGVGFYVVLNRSKLVVQEEDATGHQII